MAWFKVDDGFYSSQKFLSIDRELQVQAAGAWLLCGTWAADKMTDGFVPYGVMELWPFSQETLDELVRVGLWVYDDDLEGIRFHDWSDYQPTREQLEAKRADVSAMRSENGRKGGVKSAEVRRSKREANVKQNEANVKQTPSPEPEPEPEPINVNQYTVEFLAWWTLYPKKVNKGSAFRAFQSALNRITADELIRLTTRFSESNLPAYEYIPHPATWLNDDRWADQAEPLPRYYHHPPEEDWMYPDEQVANIRRVEAEMRARGEIA